MAETELSGAPLPVSTYAPDVVNDIAVYADFVDENLALLRARDESDRDNRFLQRARPGQVIAGENNRIWIRTDFDTWVTVHERRGPSTTGILSALSGNFSIDEQRAVLINGVIYIRFAISYSGGFDLKTGTESGTFVNEYLPANIAPQWRPPVGVYPWFRTGRSAGHLEIYPSGNVRLMTMYPGNDIIPGDRFTCVTSYPVEM